MDYTQLVQLVSTVGFPIVMCGVLAWYIQKLTDKHSDEMKGITEALNNNTTVLQQLLDKVGK
jgi:hypothetical protein